ncbi:glycine cleavage system aminomethyltransferase GcvT [Caldibacillus lycopersici]|uniref:Aminomethyltransferase n=1 Tax=Perspicuibacillus lycopersici TaxID=1325689 RepID=A0AAE3IT04_9BACI|nr:glycine cleavage system aminomethyltransferase GcvT [Perspicuibacillus lycopersici]MCU9613852.1 glycine cleavage system aminomethyltransferase GcvT [Perspicuibacillus lycopersici]
MTDLKRTPLFDTYKEWGAKTVDFGGWELPVQFSSIKEEHEAVRTKAGLFDVSHMGEIMVSGTNAENYLQKMLTNDVSKIKIGRAQYTIMCYEDGGTVDDLLVYRLEENSYLLVVNASNTDKDFAWLKQHQMEEVTIENVSPQYAQLAIQGPLAQTILQKIANNTDLSEISFFSFQTDVQLGKVSALVSRTGYTGEDGFEIYLQAADAPYLWNEILAAGKNEGILPCGLGARDTLRFEAGLPLYGQELSREITPIEAGVSFAVKSNKPSFFLGKDILQDQKENGPTRKLVGIEMIDRGIPRHGYKVFKDGEEIGFVTSGTQSPTYKKNIGHALLQASFTELGTEIFVEIRGKHLKGKVVATPFYKKNK